MHKVRAAPRASTDQKYNMYLTMIIVKLDLALVWACYPEPRYLLSYTDMHTEY